jgi:cytoskeletal protein RodZ
MLSVGELLSKERIRKGLTLKQIEKEIRVREKVLQAVEDNNWEDFSSKIYITGVIKNYAQFLNLDPNKMIIFFRRDYEKKEDIRFKKRVSASYLRPQTKRIIYGSLFLVLLLFSIYFGYQLKIFFSPPIVTIVSPKQSHFNSVNSIKVVGRTDKEANIVIFGEKVYPNKDGVFEYEMSLAQKNNILVIDVTGANGKKTTLKKTFIRD